MIPMGRLATTHIESAFNSPDDIDPPNEVTDYELGGIALNDPSAGLQNRVWTAYANRVTGEVFLVTAGLPDELVITLPGISELSLTFDQNMRPFLSYVQDDQSRFWWYDTVLGAYRITDLGIGDHYPRVCLDDKRQMQTEQGRSDVILAYIRAGNLYYRQQRDRFETEYLLGVAPVGCRLLRVGMAVSRRLQFLFEFIV